MRAILRQDPDIILIGEIRDFETLEVAISAALTGHLVLSTVHTNSAAATVTRLIEMGAKDYLVSSTLSGVIAQRLVKRLCPECKRTKYADSFEKEVLGVPENAEVAVCMPNGCLKCGGSGYAGRIGVYEIMPITPNIKRVIAAGGDSEQIKEVALREGMSTLRMSAAKLVLQGVTSMSEMKRISFEE